MSLRNSTSRWGAVSIALHWLTFVLVLGIAIVGLLMSDLATSPTKIQVYALHKSFGLTVFALTAARLLWRLAGPFPDPVDGTPPWQSRIASLTHGALYALLLAVPLSGWWFNSTAGFPLRWFGLFALPKLGSFDRQMKHLARDTHELLFYAMAALIVAHAAAALWHHYRLRDHTFLRMLPAARPPVPDPGT